ncbi:MAG: KH domain-containing protein [Candidatus Micrarchaeia archaeon]
MAFLVVSPKRVPFLRKTREAIKAGTGVDVEVSSDGSVSFAGEPDKAWAAEQVCRAIGYGFQPRQALKLLGDDYYLDVIHLKDVYSRKAKKVKRYKARVIGSGGKVKNNLQELSGAWVSIYEDDVALLGKFEDLQTAKAAVYKILEGAEHSTVYAFLERLQNYR